jgi:hypothetical protein
MACSPYQRITMTSPSLAGRLIAQTVVSTGGESTGLDSAAAIFGALLSNGGAAGLPWYLDREMIQTRTSNLLQMPKALTQTSLRLTRPRRRKTRPAQS